MRGRILLAWMIIFVGSQLRGQGSSPTAYTWLDWVHPSYYLSSDQQGKIGLIYQSQYHQAQQFEYSTLGAYSSWQFDPGNGDHWGLQLSGFLDQSAALLDQYQFLLGGSYQKRLSHSRATWQHWISAGAQAGLTQFNLREDRFWFSSQYDLEQIQIDWSKDPADPLYQQGFQSNMMGFVHGGLHYRVSNQQFTLDAVIQVNYINSPSFTLTGIEQNIPPAYECHLLPSFSLHPDLTTTLWTGIYKQGKTTIYQVGSFWSIAGGSIDDWKIIAGPYYIFSPGVELNSSHSLGGTVELFWKSYGISFRLHRAISKGLDIGQTIQVGMEYVIESD